MWLNAVPVAFLMENVLVLYGIRNGMADSALAVLASFIHLTMPFMIFGRNLIGRFGLARAWSIAWAFRYFFALILLFAPLAGRFGQWGATTVIMVGAFGFALFRSLGAISGRPLIGELTTRDERGRYIYGNFARFTTVHLISMAAAILLMQTFNAVWVYQMFILVGALVGFAGAYVLSTIPESGESRAVAMTPLITSARELLQDDVRRRTVWAFGAGFTSFMLVIPFATITVKNGYGVPDHQALIFTLLVVAGGILSSLINREISDHVGPRPLVIIYTAGFLAVALFWAFAPEVLHPTVVGLGFFVAGYCKTGLIVGLGHYLLSVTPGKHRVATTLFSEIVGGAAAGLAGSLFGGTLIGLLQGVGSGMDVYRWYFRIVVAVIMALVVVMGRLRRIEDWRVPEVLGLVFSPRDVWAIFTINRLEGRSTAGSDLHDVARLGRTGSSLSQARLREYVDSPRLEVRMQALRALRHLDMDEESVEVVMEQLRTGAFTTAWLAADILGERGITEAIPALRGALDSEDPLLVGKAMVNLVRLGDAESFDAIRERFAAAGHVRAIMYGSKAIARIGRPADLRLLLDKVCATRLPDPVKDEVLIGAATLWGAEERYYRLIRRYQDDPAAALVAAVDGLDLEEVALPRAALSRPASEAAPKGASSGRAFLEAWQAGDRRGALDALQSLVRAREGECAQHLAGFLQTACADEVDERTALCLYLLAVSC